MSYAPAGPRRLLLGLLPLSLLLALSGCSKPPAAEPLPRAVRTVTVQAAGAALAHEYPAEIRARTESRLGFRVGGKLLSRSVNLGDTVRAGQVLAQLDPRDLALGQDAARAALSAAQAALDQAEADYKRYQSLREQGFIGAAELDRREATLKTARAQADQARAQVAVQSNQTGYARLVADTGGVVTAVEAEPGAVLAAGSPVLRLAQDGPRDAVFSVPEDRIGALRPLLGKPGAVRLKLWGDPQAGARPATLRELSAAADPVTRTFLVKADVGGAAVRLGQTASVLIDSVVASSAIKLPVQAVFEQGGKPAVWVLDRASMTVTPQPVMLAGAEGNLVVLAGGLSAGQVVVSAGVHVLTPGQKVRLYQEPGSQPVAGVDGAGPGASAQAGAASALASMPSLASSMAPPAAGSASAAVTPR